MPRKKTYTVTYAENVPHYGQIEIEATSRRKALAWAKAENFDSIYFDDADYGSSSCRRIVQIEDEDGAIIAEDIALDPYYLMDEANVPRRLCEHAAALLEALELCEDALSDLARTDDGTPSVSAMNMARAAIAAVKGGRS